jgi:hypothetical protein
MEGEILFKNKNQSIEYMSTSSKSKELNQVLMFQKNLYENKKSHCSHTFFV